jgi:hypothetical protein
MNINLNILNQKFELIQWLSATEDSSVIEKIMDGRKQETVDGWHSISGIEKVSIENGLTEAETVNFQPQLNIRALYEKWLLNSFD